VMWQILMQRLSLFTNEWYNEGTLVWSVISFCETYLIFVLLAKEIKAYQVPLVMIVWPRLLHGLHDVVILRLTMFPLRDIKVYWTVIDWPFCPCWTSWGSEYKRHLPRGHHTWCHVHWWCIFEGEVFSSSEWFRWDWNAKQDLSLCRQMT
jgi:hypothetical protein